MAISVDCWTSSHNAGAHLLNVNAIANGTSVLLDCVFAGTESITNELIADKVHGVLEDYAGSDKVVAFVSDWGSNMLKASERFEEEGRLQYFLAGVGCAQHLINNALKDFGKTDSMTSVLEDTKKVVTYITGHSVPRALYDRHKVARKGTALSKAGGTRFGTNVLSMDSVKRNE